MKKLMSIALAAASFTAGHAFGSVEQECTAEIKNDEGTAVVSATEIGWRWVAVHKALSTCQERAAEAGLNPDDCKISECVEVEDPIF